MDLGTKTVTVDVMRRDDADLDASRNVIDDTDGLGLRVSGEAVGDDVVLHLPRGLGACLLPIDGLTRWALKTAILDEYMVYDQLSVLNVQYIDNS